MSFIFLFVTGKVNISLYLQRFCALSLVTNTHEDRCKNTKDKPNDKKYTQHYKAPATFFTLAQRLFSVDGALYKMP